MRLSRERDGTYGCVIVPAAFTANMVWICGIASFGVVYPEFLDYFGASNTVTSWISSLHVVTYGCSGLLVGGLVKRYGVRKIGIIGSLVMASGFIMASFSTHIYFLFPTYGLVTGIGAMMIFNPATTVIQTFFVKKRGLANGISMVGTSIAIFVWPPLVQWFLDMFGWRGSLILMAGFILHGIPLALLYTEIDNDKNNTDATITTDANSDVVKERTNLRTTCANYLGCSIWKNVGFVLQTICYFCVSFTYYLYLNFIPVRALSIGIEKYRAAFLISIYGMSNAFARVFIALTLDRKGVNRLMMYIVFTVTFGTVTIFIPFLTDYKSLVAGMVISGFCIGCSVCIQPVLLVEIVGVHNIAVAMGHTMAFVGIAALIATTCAGFIADLTGEYVLQFHTYGATTVFGGLIMAALPIVRRLRRRSRQQYDFQPNNLNNNDPVKAY